MIKQLCFININCTKFANSCFLATRADNGSMGHGTMGQMGHIFGWVNGSWVKAFDPQTH